MSMRDSDSSRGGAARTKQIVAVCSLFPEPLDEGDPVRAAMLLESLIPLGALTVFAVRRPTTTSEDEEALRKRLKGATVVAVDRDHRGGTLRRVARALMALQPVWIRDRYSAEIASRLKESQADICVLVGDPSGAYAAAVGHMRTVWDKSNVLSVSAISNLRTPSSVRELLRNAFNLPLTRRFERRAIRAVSEVWVTSPEESVRLQSAFGTSANATVPSAVDLPDGLPVRLDPESKTIVWASTLSYAPNWNGLVRFIRSAEGPFISHGVRLRVCGRGMTASKQKKLDRFEFVEAVGFVPDLREALEGTAGGVVPVWSGAGVKLKTLTLAAMGLPVYSTSVGMEGIAPEVAHFVSDDPAELVRRIVADIGVDLSNDVASSRQVVRDSSSADVFRANIRRAINGE